MAVAKMEKLKLTFKAAYIDEAMRLMQKCRGIHIETGFESTIPPAAKAEVDRDIRETERILQEIQAAYSILKGRESANMLSLFKSSEEKKLGITELAEIVESSGWENILNEVIQTDRRLQNNRTRRREITALTEKLEIWEYLRCNPLYFAKLSRAAAFYGSVHKNHGEDFAEKLSGYEEKGICFEKAAEHNDRVYFLLLCHIGMRDTLDSVMNEFSFSAEEYIFSLPQAEMKADLESEEAALIEEEKELGTLIAKQAQYDEIIEFAEDYHLNILLRKKKSLEITYEGDNIIINGWLISEKRRQFETLIAEAIPPGDYNIIFKEARDADIAEVPIKLKNNRLVAIYESLTEMYSLPKYNEIDPTFIMTIFYFVFFGLMVSDVGYGLAVFLVGLFAKKFLRLKRGTKGFIDFLFYLSFPIMGWGFVCGSFCGVELPFALITIPADIIPMTILSIVLGYLHIMAGLVLQMINRAHLRQYYDMVSGGLAWFLIFLGGAAMIITGIAPGFGNDVVFFAGAAVLAAGFAMVVVVPAVQYGKRWYAGVGKGLYALYGATSYLGDFVSYTRLMALGVAGGSVALAFNTIFNLFPLPLKFTLGIVIAVVLHALNIILSMLSAYVHGIRLHFIEFFGKFYTGGGKKFEPFKAAEKNIIISEPENTNYKKGVK